MMLLPLTIVPWLLATVLVTGASLVQDNNANSTQSSQQFIKDNEIVRYNTYSPVRLFPELPLVAPGSSVEQCRKDSELFQDGIDKLKIWAFKMWDSSAKRPSGLVHGLGHHLGDFDECLAVNGPLKTRYCLATLIVQVPKPNHTENVWENQDLPITDVLYYNGDLAKYRRDELRWGLCVPQSCPANDIKAAVSKTLENTPVPNVKYQFELKEENCQVDKMEAPLSAGEICFVALSLALVFIVVGASLTDIIKNKDVRNKKPVAMQDKLISMFSMRENMTLWLQKEKNDATAVFHPMRLFFMLIIINGHRYVTQLMGPMSNAVLLEKINRTLPSMLVARGDLLVDSFILLSGLLTTYACLAIPEKKQLSFVRAFILRYLRLTPVYAYVIFFMATMFYRTGHGPLWHEYAGFEQDNCQANWWVNLLHLNNYVNLSNWCMLQSFYVPLDIHFFILSFPLNLLLKKNLKWGFIAIGASFVVATIIPFVLTIVYDMPAAIYMFNNYLLTFRINPMVTTMYIKTHNRFGAYLIGMLGGYIYYKLKGKERFIPYATASVISTFGAALAVCTMLMGYPFFQLEPTHVVYRALYAALQRPIWALGNLICIIGLSYGKIPVLPKVLSWGGFPPMARLTYGMYLTNMQFQMWDVASLRQPFHFDPSTWAFAAFYDTFMSMFFAFFLYVGIETPFGRLAKEFITPKAPPKKSNETNGHVTHQPKQMTTPNDLPPPTNVITRF